jgi:hypothetical protein
MNDKTFYAVLIESEETKEESFVQVLWTWANSIGDAISDITSYAINAGIKNPLVREIDPYDFESLPDEVNETNTTGVFTSGVRYYYPATPCLKIPKGVIESALEGDFDTEELHKGFIAYTSDDDFYCIDTVLYGDELKESFIQLCSVLPEIRVSWVEISHEWDNEGKTQLFANEDLNSATKIDKFLSSNKLNILQNGFLKFTVYCNEGASNLLIDDHKQICLMSRSQNIQRIILDKLTDLGINESDSLKSISRGFHHWHYNPKDSFNRKELISYLKSNGFSLWKEIEAKK